MTHRFEDGLRAPAGLFGLPRTNLEGQPGPIETITDGGDEQILLGSEQLKQIRLRDTGTPGNSCGRGPGVTIRGKLDRRRRD